MEKENVREEELPPDALPDGEQEADFSATSAARPEFSRRRIILICSIIFLVATGCRLLSWHDNRFEARKVQTAVTEGYKHTGRILQQGGITSFFSPNSPLADPNHLGHPPGYSILIAIIFSLFGEEDAALQIIQILADAAAAVIIFLLALQLLNIKVSAIAGLLVALAPQFTYNCVMLLPDSLAVLPILLAVYFLTRAFKRPRLLTFMLAGAFVGLSCWLRANAMLLAPFMAALVPILIERGRRLRFALALVGANLLVIVPLTVRNYIVYDHFIPVSLGAGQTLLEGIADYDANGSLGIPNTDMGLMKWEAGYYNRPDYYGTLFNPEGVRRERLRLAQGFSVIRSHPLWFAGVMVRRAGSMLRLERVRLISLDPPVTHSLAVNDATPPAWSSSARGLLENGTVPSGSVKVMLTPDEQMLQMEGDASRNQFISAPFSLEGQKDYLLKLPVRIEQGRAMVSVVGVHDNHQYASMIVEVQDWKAREEQPLNVIEIAFVSRSPVQAQLIFSNAGAEGVNPVLQFGEARLYALGPASFNWTRIPRFLVRLVQKLFITAVMLPLAIFGLFLMIRARRRLALAVLLIVPVYYLSVQSALHTEYRYVLALHYFLFVLVALALYHAGSYLRSRLPKIPSLRR